MSRVRGLLRIVGQDSIQWQRALVEQEDMLTHISTLIQDPDIEMEKFGTSQLLGSLLEDTTALL